jgi:hypothetical protein
MVRETAALSLAKSGHAAALEALGTALRQGGTTAELAELALLAHPPRNLAPVLRARGAPTVALVRALGELGDQRGFHVLRDAASRGGPEVRAEASVALTRLGDLETVELARHWLKTEKNPLLRIAATRILCMTHTADRGAAIAGLLLSPDTHAAGLELALAAPHPSLSAPLAATLPALEPPGVRTTLSALGRIPGAGAVKLLGAELAKPDRAAAAAYALGLAVDEQATYVLESASRQALTRRLAARAGVVRAVTLAEPPRALQVTLETLLGSRDAGDRAVGAWGLAVLDRRRGRELLHSRDTVIVRAVARAALDEPFAIDAAQRLLVESEPVTRAALSIALAHLAAAERIPTKLVVFLLDEVPAAAPLAARVLARRNPPDLRSRVEALQTSSDPLLRAHTALGMSEGDPALALGALSRMYRYETDAAVRRAIVSGLGRLPPSRLRHDTLELAASLDPDPEARQRARFAPSLARRQSFGQEPLWVEVTEAAPGAQAQFAVLAILATDLALPAVPDPDGIVSMIGLPAGPIRLRLAPVSNHGKAQAQ